MPSAAAAAAATIAFPAAVVLLELRLGAHETSCAVHVRVVPLSWQKSIRLCQSSSCCCVGIEVGINARRIEY